MKVPRVRLTVWRLMTVIAILAVSMYGTILYRRLIEFRECAAFAGLSRALRERAANPGDTYRCGLAPDGPPPTPESTLRLADHYGALGRKYEHAATRPWLSVEHDPPRPQ
ncbi:MAG TPA: hypothetical protein VGH33_06875 [Isosphaeraceae bacterium]